MEPFNRAVSAGLFQHNPVLVQKAAVSAVFLCL